MANKGIAVGLILVLSILSSTIVAQTLELYLNDAVKNNPGLKAKYTEFEIAMQKIPQVSSLPDPTLSFGYYVSPVETRIGPQKARLSLTQMFPWFGTLAAKKDAVTLLAEAKYQAFLDAKNELVFKVTAAYYPLYEVNEMLRLQKENLQILTSYKQLATTAFSNAKGSMVDVIRVDIMIDEAKTNIDILDDKLSPLQAAFNQLLDRDMSLPIIIADRYDIAPGNAILSKDSLLIKNPQLKGLDLKIKSAKALEKAAFRNGLPKFGIGLTYAFVDERTDMNVTDNGKDAIMPMISMSIPLYRGKYKAAVKEARLKQSSFALQKQNKENILFTAYDLSFFKIDRAKQQFVLYAAQIAKTQQAIDLLHTTYSNSGKDFEEVLRMQQRLLKYEMAKATAVKEYYTALAQHNYITGK
ncbi:MAG: TolC family protein [Deferribacteres bacterium]|nr:TolC family protein [candidate division KSB1 bacterium]MCB9503167.1 TolC family protein [Deferribacteres bacterium]